MTGGPVVHDHHLFQVSDLALHLHVAPTSPALGTPSFQEEGRGVLERLVSMPLSTWNYKAQDDSIRHMGPMAQDFHAAFGLGVSDKLIDTIDPDGVALAAIQGLHALVEENEIRLAEKDAEIDELRARLERLEVLAMSK